MRTFLSASFLIRTKNLELASLGKGGKIAEIRFFREQPALEIFDDGDSMIVVAILEDKQVDDDREFLLHVNTEGVKDDEEFDEACFRGLVNTMMYLVQHFLLDPNEVLQWEGRSPDEVDDDTFDDDDNEWDDTFDDEDDEEDEEDEDDE